MGLELFWEYWGQMVWLLLVTWLCILPVISQDLRRVWKLLIVLDLAFQFVHLLYAKLVAMLLSLVVPTGNVAILLPRPTSSCSVLRSLHKSFVNNRPLTVRISLLDPFRVGLAGMRGGLPTFLYASCCHTHFCSGVYVEIDGLNHQLESYYPRIVFVCSHFSEFVCYLFASVIDQFLLSVLDPALLSSVLHLQRHWNS